MSDQARPPAAYADLRAVYINCTLKRTPDLSHTQGLMDRSIALMRFQGVTVDTIRFIDHDVATGVYPDMREHGWATDAWPDEIWPRIDAADILVIGGLLRNTTFMTWNLLHMARMLKDAGGIPAYGNVRGAWDHGERFGFDANPEYR